MFKNVLRYTSMVAFSFPAPDCFVRIWLPTLIASNLVDDVPVSLYSPSPHPSTPSLLDQSQSPIPSGSSTASVTPTATPDSILRYNGPTLEGLLFGPAGLGGSTKSFSPAEGRAPTEEGDDIGPSPAPEARGVFRQFSLDLSMNSPSPNG